VTDQARRDEPRYRLHVQYTFEDYDEAVHGDATVAFGGLRWRGLVAWAVVFTVVIAARSWLRPERVAPGAAPLPLGRALLNLLAALLPLCFWALLLGFALLNTYLAIRGRKRPARPLYQEVKPGNEASFGGRHGWTILLALALVANGLVGAATSAGDAEGGERGFARDAVVRVLPIVVIVGVGAIILWYGARGRIRRAWRGQPSLHLGHTFEFFDDRVLVDTTQSRTETKWTAFPRVLETPNLLLLYVSDVAFHILPKRSLAGAGELERFRGFLVNRVEGKTQAFPVIALGSVNRPTPDAPPVPSPGTPGEG
jgi:hypothetical protein